MQGRVIAWDLAQNCHNVLVLDLNPENPAKAGLLRLPNIKVRKFDVRDRQSLIRLLKEFDIIVGALPASLGFYAMECAIAAKVDMVDISYLKEDPFLLNKSVKKRKIKIVPDAGFAPGLSNILVGEAYAEINPIESLRILAGGIPQNPVPPFNYYITWSLTDLVEEYLRPVRLRKNFKTVTVESLTGVENLYLPKIGRLECFYTDGLRTLLKTLKDIRNMEEKTIRYPGHANLFKALKYCTEGYTKPKEFRLKILRPLLTQGDDKDISILIIEIKGKKGRRKYTCIDYYDDKNRITSMARMTGFTASIITQSIKEYQNFGIIPPEYLGMDKFFSSYIKHGLKKRGVKIVQSN